MDELLASNSEDEKDKKEQEDKKEAENKAKNEDTERSAQRTGSADKRKLIDEIGGILKGKVDEELWRTIIGKAEKIAYSKSEAGTADNKDDEGPKKI